VAFRAPHARGSRGFFDPFGGHSRPLRESLYKISIVDFYVNSVWTLLTLGPCGPQVAFAPTGLTLRLVLCSTWGDQHYIGLNGVEVLYPYALNSFAHHPVHFISGAPYKYTGRRETDVKTHA
jgi:hypothetical protein